MSQEAHELQTLPKGARIASYSIVRVIGRGGMGVVYEGLHEALGKRVAIKTLITAAGQSQDVQQRFVREGKAAARIRHPHVCDVFDVGVHEGVPYLVMEYLEGEDLGSWIESRPLMRTDEIADLIIPVASALAAAHDAGVIHRDLKPDNVFIVRGKTGTLVPKLLDFGISKLDDAAALNLTGTNAILGTPYYMSPEQAGSSRTVDHRSDVFSLGVILYQCATRELPFKGDSLFQLLGAILHSEPVRASQISLSLPNAFEGVIGRAMQKDPSKRYQTAAQLGAALLPFASPRIRLQFESELGGIEAMQHGDTLATERTTAELLRTPMPATTTISEVAIPVPAKSKRPLLAIVAVALLALIGIGVALSGRGGETEGAHVVSPAGRPNAPVAAAPPAPPEPEPGLPPAADPTPVAKVEDPAATQDAAVADPTFGSAPLATDASGKPRKRPKKPGDKPVTPVVAPTVPAGPAEPSTPKPLPEDLFRDRK
jgi:serine/threonine-protein kinase